jgi:hypothetical protein
MEYAGVWSTEVARDPFLPVLLAAEHTPRLAIETAIAGRTRAAAGCGIGSGRRSTIPGVRIEATLMGFRARHRHWSSDIRGVWPWIDAR